MTKKKETIRIATPAEKAEARELGLFKGNGELWIQEVENDVVPRSGEVISVDHEGESCLIKWDEVN